MFCPQCGKPSDNPARFCANCGSALAQVAAQGVAQQAAERPSGSSDELLCAVVGTKNQAYYLRHFSRFEAQGKTGFSWHWPAFFVTFYWLLYRKMWLAALIYFFLPYLVMVPIGMALALFDDSGSGAGIAYFAYFIAVMGLPPMYANAFYYKHCQKKIGLVGASASDRQRQIGELSAKGGTSNALLIVFSIVLFLAVIGILAAIAIPAYQDYTTRARMADAAAIGNRAARSVADYYGAHREIPDNLDQAGFPAVQSPSVRTVAVDRQTGVVTVTMASAPVADKMLLLVPSLAGDDRIDWTCVSDEIPGKYLPPQCRQN